MMLQTGAMASMVSAAFVGTTGAAGRDVQVPSSVAKAPPAVIASAATLVVMLSTRALLLAVSEAPSAVKASQAAWVFALLRCDSVHLRLWIVDCLLKKS